MAIQNVFGSTVPGAVNISNDSDQIVLGFLFKVATAGNIVGYRFYEGNYNYPSNTREGSLWSVSGTQLATKVAPAMGSNGWKEVLFDAPVAVSANTPYMVSVFFNLGNWSASFGGFNSDVVSGDITVYGFGNTPDSMTEQGRYIESPVNAFPIFGSGGRSAYGMDVMFEAGSSQVDITGSTAITFAASGAMSRQVNLAGSSPLTFGASGSIKRQVNLIGTTLISLGATGHLTLTRKIAGLAAVLFRATGRINANDPSLVISEKDGIYILEEVRGRYIAEEIRGIYK